MASTLPAWKSGLYADPREDWLALYSEEVIDPARPIVDPHHHLWDADPDVAHMYATRPKGLLLDPTFRKGFACLAPLGLSFDAWLFHPQISELTDLARAFPDTRIVLDHCGGPVGIGVYANRREELFPVWQGSIQEVAKCHNVMVKLGGLAMRLLGHDFHERPKPPSSEQL